MKNRKNYLKLRKSKFIWRKIGMFSDSPCPNCGRMGRVQIYRHDAWCCIYCNEWHEKKCGDENCPFCSDRPDTPYEVYWNYREKPMDALERKNWRRDNYAHKENGKSRHLKKYKRKDNE